MPTSKAISQALSIAIVIAIIVVAFGGYAVGSLVQKSPQTITITNLTGNRMQTVTELEVVVRTGFYTQYVYQNCTTGGGTISLSNPSTTTTYIMPSNATGTLVATITTTESQSTTVSTVVIHAKPSPYTIQEVNGTITTYTTETCPTYA